MNEIMVHTYIRRLVNQGIHKVMAKQIIDMAIDSSKGNDIEMAIKYAIDLVYGYGLTQNKREDNRRSKVN